MALYHWIIIFMCFHTLHGHNLTKLTDHSAMWIKMGKIFTTTSYSHLHIPIKTTELRERQKMMEVMNKRFQVLQVPGIWTKSKRANAKARLHDLQRFVK